MSDPFPAQSHKSREPRETQREVLPITTSEARVRKAPWSRRFRETFIQGDAHSVWGSMFWEVFLPGVRDNIANAVHDGIDSLFSGVGTVSSRRNRYNSYNSNSRYSNNGISKHNPDRALGGGSTSRFDEDARRNHDFSVLEIDSRVEAEEVLSQMNLHIDQYDVCTLADFYQMVRITPAHTDYKFGWEDLGGARVVASRGSFYLDLPRVITLR